MFDVEYSTRAIAFLDRFQQKDSARIIQKIESIRDNPYTHLKKMQGNGFWRLRISQYRAMIDIIIENKILLVVRIGYRKDIYKKRS